MSYHSSRNASIWLNVQREQEERKLRKKKFTARYSGSVRRSIVIMAAIMLLIAAIQVLVGEGRIAAGIILLVTSPMLLLMPTVFSYRCHVDQQSIRESCLILCVPYRKEVLWRDVRSRKVRRDQWDHIISIKLYNEKGRKVFSMGRDITGVGLICHMAREKGIPNRK